MAVEPNLMLLPGPGQPGQEKERPHERPGPEPRAPWRGGSAALIVPVLGVLALIVAVLFGS
jgi:hypothetical protein